jgi:hypothetical protein
MSKINFYILLFFLIAKCGYEPMYSKNKMNYSIGEIQISEKNQLNRKIKSNLKNYFNKNKKKDIYDLKIKSNKKITIISKNTKGNAIIFNMEMELNLEIIKKDSINKTKVYKEEFSYTNNSNKFELSGYEENIENNLINKIIDNILLDLYSLQNDI